MHGCINLCKSPKYVMEELNPTPVATTQSPKIDSDSDVDDDMIEDFVSSNTPVKTAAKPPIAVEEKSAEAEQKPVKLFDRHCRLPTLPNDRSTVNRISVCTVKRT